MASAKQLANPLLIEDDRERTHNQPSPKRWRVWEAGVITHIWDARRNLFKDNG